mmetsp:Transcript_45823/g.133419  ORF Transcript_45823/g.133419 Transcript_45823/m.133419 type:complete len:326 (-) Transcript_45823:151-1128(-)
MPVAVEAAALRQVASSGTRPEAKALLGSAAFDAFLRYLMLVLRATGLLLETLFRKLSQAGGGGAAAADGALVPLAAPALTPTPSPTASATPPRAAPEAQAHTAEDSAKNVGHEAADNSVVAETESTAASTEDNAGTPAPPPKQATMLAGGVARRRMPRLAPAFVESLQADSQREFAAQLRAISTEAFEEDATAILRKGERIALALLDDIVVGYASYAIRPQQRSLNIIKLAVSTAHRRMGLGRALLRHLIQLAKRPIRVGGRQTSGGKAPSLEVVCLSALPTSIAFYKACGFQGEPGVGFSPEDVDELVDGQLYMEFRLRRKAAR